MEDKKHQITSLTEAQIPAAGALLAEAFFADPLTVTFFPETQVRRCVLTWYYTATVRALAPFQGTYATAGFLKGVAIWVPPGMREDELPMWKEQSGVEAYRRFLKAIDYLTPLRQAAFSSPFWYLSWIGVAAAEKRQGLGSALLAPALLQADQAGLPCYLETFERQNLLFYRRHGFEVAVHQVQPESGLEFWTMRREPHRL